MKIKTVQTEPHPIYDVDVQPFDWNEFLDWLASRLEPQMTVFAFDNAYVFRTINERMQFVLGFQAAWDEFTGTKNRHAKGRKKPTPKLKRPEKVKEEKNDRDHNIINDKPTG
jgi:hypothetical protein